MSKLWKTRKGRKLVRRKRKKASVDRGKTNSQREKLVRRKRKNNARADLRKLDGEKENWSGGKRKKRP